MGKWSGVVNVTQGYIVRRRVGKIDWRQGNVRSGNSRDGTINVLERTVRDLVEV